MFLEAEKDNWRYYANNGIVSISTGKNRTTSTGRATVIAKFYLDNMDVPDQIIHRFDDKYKSYWYNIGDTSCSIEGSRMGHCGDSEAGDMGGGILYSLRTPPKRKRGGKETDKTKKIGGIFPDDKFSKSYVTIALVEEGDDEGLITQIKGRDNKAPPKIMWPYILWFIDNMNVDAMLDLATHTDEESSNIFKELSEWLINKSKKTITVKRSKEDIYDEYLENFENELEQIRNDFDNENQVSYGLGAASQGEYYDYDTGYIHWSLYLSEISIKIPVELEDQDSLHDLSDETLEAITDLIKNVSSYDYILYARAEIDIRVLMIEDGHLFIDLENLEVASEAVIHDLDTHDTDDADSYMRNIESFIVDAEELGPEIAAIMQRHSYNEDILDFVANFSKTLKYFEIQENFHAVVPDIVNTALISPNKNQLTILENIIDFFGDHMDRIPGSGEYYFSSHLFEAVDDIIEGLISNDQQLSLDLGMPEGAKHHNDFREFVNMYVSIERDGENNTVNLEMEYDLRKALNIMVKEDTVKSPQPLIMLMTLKVIDDNFEYILDGARKIFLKMLSKVLNKKAGRLVSKKGYHLKESMEKPA
jgi:hypothetical protein